MHSRRDLLKNIGIGAAAVAATAGTVKAAEAAHKATLEAFASGGSTKGSPWWLIAPLRPGSQVGQGWAVAGLSRVERGAAVLELQHRDGQVARLHVCGHEGRPKGLAHSVLFDLVLMDGGRGDRRTPEGLGRALLGVADRIRKNEMVDGADLDSVARMLPHDERVELFGAETLA
jgi:hypothetical protein